MKVLCISAHPDDETLGCGGTLLKHVRQGDELYWLIGTSAYAPDWPDDVVAAKKKEVEQVAAAYGMKEVYRLGIKATQVDAVPMRERVGGIWSVVEKVAPQQVYMVHGGDIHSDHRCLYEAAVSVFKSFKMRDLGVRSVLSFETLSSTDPAAASGFMPFVPGVYVDISEFMEQKWKVMEIYRSELQGGFLPRSRLSLTALARYRGAAIGVEFAEAFHMVLEVR